jgi:hypothetical protein
MLRLRVTPIDHLLFVSVANLGLAPLLPNLPSLIPTSSLRIIDKDELATERAEKRQQTVPSNPPLRPVGEELADVALWQTGHGVEGLPGDLELFLPGPQDAAQALVIRNDGKTFLAHELPVFQYATSEDFFSKLGSLIVMVRTVMRVRP